jgi:hypothetical protein
MSWTRWFRAGQPKNNSTPKTTRAIRRTKKTINLQLEALEDRTVPTIRALSTAAFAVAPTVTGGTANGQSETSPMHSISDDGRFTVFVSNASNVVGTTSTGTNVNVYLFDKAGNSGAGSTIMLSHAAGLGTGGNDNSFNPVISGDGSTVVFYSKATNLISGQTPTTGTVQLYLYDRVGGTLKLITHQAGLINSPTNGVNPWIPTTGGGAGGYINTLGYSTGQQGGLGVGLGLALPGVSANGQYITYVTDASNLGYTDPVDGVSLSNFTQVVLYDRAADTNTLVSHNSSSSTTGASGFASTTAISADGTTVAFTSPAGNLNGTVNGTDDNLFVWSRTTNATTGLTAGQVRLASHTAASATTGATISGSFLFGFTGDTPPALSSDGTAIAYYDAGSDLVNMTPATQGTASVLNVFRYNVVANSNELVSHIFGNTTTAGNNPANQVAALGVGPAEATGPLISPDGRYIAYANNSNNLVSATPFSNGNRDNVYLYDHNSTLNVLVSHAAGSTTNPDTNGGTAPGMSADGRFVTFVDWAYPTSGATSAAASVRLYDSQATATVQPIVLGAAFDANTSAAIDSGQLAPTIISADGTTINWDGSAAANVANDLNTTSGGTSNLDVFQYYTPAQPGPTGITFTAATPAITAGRQTATAVGTLTTTTAGTSNTFTYTLVTGVGSTDNNKFTLSPSGAIATNQIFLNAVSTNYSIRVQTTDGNNQSYQTAITITVGASTTPPTNISLTGTTVQQPSTVVGTLSTTDPNFGVTETYTVTNSVPFTISGNSLVTAPGLTVTTPTTYSVTVQVTNSLNQTFSRTFPTITVNPPPPTDITLSNASVTTYQPIGTVVGTLNTVDPNTGQTFTYGIVSTDGPFTISGSNLVTTAVLTNTTTYHVQIQTTDSPANQSFTRVPAFAITVTPSTAPPTAINLSSSTVTAFRAGTTVGTLSTTDPNVSQTFSYTLLTTGLPFAISGSNLVTTGPITVTTQTTYTLQIRTTDAPLGQSATFPVTVTVNPSTAAPTAVSLSNSTVNAFQTTGTTVGTLSATDPNVGATETYTVVPNTTLFTVSNGNLVTNTVFNVSTPTTYTVNVLVTDSAGQTFTQPLSVTVTPPAPTDIALTSTSVPTYRASGTTVGTLSTTDGNPGQTFTYTIVSPPPGLPFTISGSDLVTTSVLTTPTSYTFQVQTTDHPLGLTFTKQFTVTVNASTATPTAINLSSPTVTAFRAAGTVGTLTTTDPNVNQTYSYQLVTTGLPFAISGNSLVTTGPIPVATTTQFTLQVTVTDQPLGVTTTLPVTVTVNQSTAAPTAINTTPSTLTVLANQSAGTQIGTFTAVDPNVGATESFSVIYPDPLHPQPFAFSGTNLVTTDVLQTVVPTTYVLNIQVIDSAGQSFTQPINVTVNPSPPTTLSLSSSTVSGSVAAGGTVATFVTAGSSAGGPYTYTLVAGTNSTDNGLFTIDNTTGTLDALAAIPVTGTLVKHVRVQVADANGLTLTQPLDITFVPAQPNSVYVNSAWAGLAAGTDPDGSGPAAAIGADAFPTIQAGIDAVNTGGTVHVAPGFYVGSVNIYKSLTLVGDAGSASTILSEIPQGSTIASGLTTGLTVTGDTVTIAGLTLQFFGTGITATGGTTLTLADLHFQINNGGSVTGVNTLNLKGSAANDNFNISATTFGYVGEGQVGYSGVAHLNVDGLDGSDTYNVALAGVGSTVTIADSGATGTDTAVFSGTSAADNIMIKDNLAILNGTDAVMYFGLEGVKVNAGAGNDTVTVKPTTASTTSVTVDAGTGSNTLVSDLSSLPQNNTVTVTKAGIGDTAALLALYYQATGGTFGGGVIVKTGAGNDLVDVKSTLAGAPTSVYTGAGNDVLMAGSSTNPTQSVLAGIASPVILDGGAGANSVTASDAADPVGQTAYVYDKAFYYNGSAATPILYQATGGTVASATLDQGTGNDTAVIRSKTAGVPTTVNSGAGNDSFNVAVSSSTALTGLNLSGGAGVNSLSVSDPANPAVMTNLSAGNGSGTVAVSYLNGQPSQVSYSGLQAVQTSVSPAESFARQVFHKVLHRDPSPAELAWAVKTQALPNGAAVFVNTMVALPEAHVWVVANWYGKYLGTPPDGLYGYWINRLGQVSQDQALSEFLATELNGTNADYVQQVYVALVGHGANADQLNAALTQKLPQSGRAGLALSVIKNAEFQWLSVINYYQTLLNRTPAPSEVATWIGLGLDQSAMEVAFLLLPQFRATAS